MNWLSLILILTAESEGENKTVLLYCLSLSKEFGNIDGFKISNKRFANNCHISNYTFTVNKDCLNKNGNCSSMCIPTLTGYICACADGMDMKDQFTCTQGKIYVSYCQLNKLHFQLIWIFFKKTVIFIFIEKIWTCF